MNIGCNCESQLSVKSRNGNVEKDTVASLNSDVLLVKQQLLACEKLRSEEIQCVTKTVYSLSSDVLNQISEIKGDISAISAKCVNLDMQSPLHQIEE